MLLRDVEMAFDWRAKCFDQYWELDTALYENVAFTLEVAHIQTGESMIPPHPRNNTHYLRPTKLNNTLVTYVRDYHKIDEVK